MILPVAATGAPLLAALHATAFSEAWDEQAFSSLLAAPGGLALVWEEAGAPAGFILARAVADEAEILTLAVTPKRRRQGVARALVEAVADRAHALGARALLLEVAQDNAAARGLYETIGFAQVGRREAYYARPSVAPAAALVLRLDLPRA